MVRSLAVLVTGLAFLAVPLQELKPEVLDRLKSATAYVVVEKRTGSSTGTAFLFLKRESVGYFMTCEHVVAGMSQVKVVLWSGTHRERTLRATVVATDPHRDIACLLVRAGDLPSPLELGKKTDVKETESVFAAGFPFGAMLAGDKKNPEISISKSSVTSIRRNADDAVALIQISGEVNPGNSGGPLVTGSGRVLGVTAAKIEGTSTAFAVPPEEIQEFLKGRVKSSTVRRVPGSETKVKYEFTLGVVDPLATLKEVGIAYIDEEKVSGIPASQKDGTWKPVHEAMSTVELDVDEDRAVESIEFTREAGKADDLTIFFQCYYVRADGVKVWTEPVLQPIEFTGKGRAAKNPGAEEGEGDPGPAVADVPTTPLALADTVAIVAEYESTSAWGGLLLAPDGSALYALDLTEAQLLKLDPDTLKVQAKIEVDFTAVSLALKPDGKTLYVVGRSAQLEKDRDPSQKRGVLQAVDTSTFKAGDLRMLTPPLVEAVCTDNDLIIASTRGSDGAVVYDFKSQTEDLVWGVQGSSAIQLSPDQKRVYTGDFGVSPADYRCLSLRRTNGKYTARDSRYHGEHPLGGNFWLTPNGRFLIGSPGSILRLGRSPETDLEFAQAIDRFQCASMARGCSTLILLTSDGFLKSYSLDSFKLERSVSLGFSGRFAILDAKRKRLHAVLLPSTTGPSWSDRTVKLGRLCSVSLAGNSK